MSHSSAAVKTKPLTTASTPSWRYRGQLSSWPPQTRQSSLGPRDGSWSREGQGWPSWPCSWPGRECPPVTEGEFSEMTWWWCGGAGLAMSGYRSEEQRRDGVGQCRVRPARAYPAAHHCSEGMPEHSSTRARPGLNFVLTQDSSSLALLLLSPLSIRATRHQTRPTGKSPDPYINQHFPGKLHGLQPFRLVIQVQPSAEDEVVEVDIVLLATSRLLLSHTLNLK